MTSTRQYLSIESQLSSELNLIQRNGLETLVGQLKNRLASKNKESVELTDQISTLKANILTSTV